MVCVPPVVRSLILADSADNCPQTQRISPGMQLPSTSASEDRLITLVLLVFCIRLYWKTLSSSIPSVRWRSISSSFCRDHRRYR